MHLCSGSLMLSPLLLSTRSLSFAVPWCSGLTHLALGSTHLIQNAWTVTHRSCTAAATSPPNTNTATSCAPATTPTGQTSSKQTRGSAPEKQDVAAQAKASETRQQQHAKSQGHNQQKMNSGRKQRKGQKQGHHQSKAASQEGDHAAPAYQTSSHWAQGVATQTTRGSSMYRSHDTVSQAPNKQERPQLPNHHQWNPRSRLFPGQDPRPTSFTASSPFPPTTTTPDLNASTPRRFPPTSTNTSVPTSTLSSAHRPAPRSSTAAAHSCTLTLNSWQTLVDVTTASTTPQSRPSKTSLIPATSATTMLGVLQVYARAGVKHTQLAAQIARHMPARVLGELTPMQVAGLARTFMTLEALDQALVYQLVRWLAFQRINTHPCEIAMIVWVISHVPLSSKLTSCLNTWAKNTLTWLESTYALAHSTQPSPSPATISSLDDVGGSWHPAQQVRLFHSGVAAAQLLHGNSKDLVQLDSDLTYELAEIVEMTRLASQMRPRLVSMDLEQRLQPYLDLVQPLMDNMRPRQHAQK